MTRQVVNITFEQAYKAYMESVAALDLSAEAIPIRYVELAAECAKRVVLEFCERNDLEMNE